MGFFFFPELRQTPPGPQQYMALLPSLPPAEPQACYCYNAQTWMELSQHLLQEKDNALP